MQESLLRTSVFVEGSLHQRPGTYLFKSHHPGSGKAAMPHLGVHRRLTSLQLCIVWLQCTFGVQNSLLLQCGPAQVHLCPEAQPLGSTGSLVFKTWNCLLPLLQKVAFSISQCFWVSAICRTMQSRKMHQIWVCPQLVAGRYTDPCARVVF